MTVKIKICGITNRDDLDLITAEKADYAGVIVGIPHSPRNLGLDQAKKICLNARLPIINLTFNHSEEENQQIVEALHPHALQLQGEETPQAVAQLRKRIDCEIWKVLSLPPREEKQSIDLRNFTTLAHKYLDAGVNRFMIDTSTVIAGIKRYGGTGKIVDWDLAHELIQTISAPVFLAGGIKPGNVSEAIKKAGPFGVDLSSGVEREQGRKDPDMVRALIQNAHESN